MVSDIRPIHEMGLWVAVGMVFTWVIVFTLFPALQKILRTPTERSAPSPDAWLVRFPVVAAASPIAGAGPSWSTALALSALGAVALFGLPGIVGPMPVLTDPVEYMDHHSPLYQDIRRLQPMIPGLSITAGVAQGAARQRLRAGGADGARQAFSKRWRTTRRWGRPST